MSDCIPGTCIFIECDSPWTSIAIDTATTVNDTDTVNLSTIALADDTIEKT